MNSNALLPISEQDIIYMYVEPDYSRANTILRIQQNLSVIQNPYILADVKNVLQTLNVMTDADFQEIIYHNGAPEE